ncbi:hypothetical protein SAMN02799630_01208 [Paenibacillus sp. UNCCL117]|uniref:hypothetical protein n=1 Tax=unclassified Paenibacillus TaxID=185978 RepID=UPI00088DA6A8|nr:MULTISPECIES: hypothetical protein [unclassified Paenibacillus]SDC69539.1 hypothetical protein SAMN04488602_103186 [Paenibacillus sp. cl123]SFW23958.1 hypothetical protein SAMN02799630_01208 [Paenibacillus sp. UNCCL117]
MSQEYNPDLQALVLEGDKLVSEMKQQLDNVVNQYESLIGLVQEVSEYLSWRDPGNGEGQRYALKLIYTWLKEHTPEGVGQ